MVLNDDLKQMISEHLHVFAVDHFAIQQFFNGRIKLRESTLFLCMWEIDRLISPGCSNVKLWIKDIDAGNNSAEPWQCECSMALILPRSIFTATI